MAESILVVDDDPSALEYAALALTREGYVVRSATSSLEALLALERELPALVISDLEMAAPNGLELLSEIKSRWPQLPVVLATVQADVATIVDAVNRGATNYLVKPISPHLLVAAVSKAIARTTLHPLARTEDLLDAGFMPEILGVSRATREVRALIAQAARSDVNVLIVGETGTGKELVARTLHRLCASQARFIAHNCAVTSSDLFDAEFFGHERGAFTGADRSRPGILAEADGGVLFLDEVECLSLANQAKLLRVLDDGEVRAVGSERVRRICVRFFAATNRSPEAMIRAGQLREDFYFRLRGFEIVLPPLCERLEDVPVLTAHFLRDMGKSLDAQALSALQSQRWRGNVRELRNVLRAACARTTSDRIERSHLALGEQVRLSGSRSSEPPGSGAASPPTLDLEEAGRQAIRRALTIHQGNISRAAEALGIHRSTLRRKLREIGIATSEFPAAGSAQGPPDASEETKEEEK
jgi:two-component system, NtrC family, response regulator HydG